VYRYFLLTVLFCVQVCLPVERQQCRDVPRQVCQQVPKTECRTVPRQQCSPVCVPTYYCEECAASDAYGSPAAPVQDTYGSPALPAYGRK
jgi:hypothetical protein